MSQIYHFLVAFSIPYCRAELGSRTSRFLPLGGLRKLPPPL